MTDILEDDRRGAVFSDDRTYRYTLWRTWDVDLPACTFVMLNPSTADESEDDPTIRRCINYAKTWGYGTLNVGNIFALRATDPEELYDHPDPVGPDNDASLRGLVGPDVFTVVAWGAHGGLDERGREVASMLAERTELFALGTTAEGHPVHPLYQPADAEPEPFEYGGGSDD